MAKPFIRYRSGYKYQLVEEYRVALSLPKFASVSPCSPRRRVCALRHQDASRVWGKMCRAATST